VREFTKSDDAVMAIGHRNIGGSEMTATIERERVTERTAPKSRLLLVAGIVTLVIGFGSVAGGAFGIWYTWDQAVAQDIVTPDDAAIPGVAVRGPLSMWAQADIITHHQLDRTNGLYYSQMDRQVPAVDEAGNPVLDENGEPVMIDNQARTSWVTATTLTTALGLGILSFAVGAFAVVMGIALALAGFVFLRIRNRAVLL
jgi:hypothetical protein